MLKFKDSKGRTKYTLRDSDLEPQETDKLIIDDVQKENSTSSEDEEDNEND